MNNTLLERFTTVYESSGMTINSFSDAIGITRQQLRNYLKGARPVSAKSALRVCEVFKIRKEWLLNGEGDMEIRLEDIAQEQEMQFHFMKEAIKDMNSRMDLLEKRMLAIEAKK